MFTHLAVLNTEYPSAENANERTRRYSLRNPATLCLCVFMHLRHCTEMKPHKFAWLFRDLDFILET